MKFSAFVGSMALILFLSGCASGQHVYSSDGKCITCWNNPVTGEAINHEGKATQEQVPEQTQVSQTTTTETTVVNTSANKPTEHKIEFTVPINVDLAFLKIKKEFNYQTEQEIRQEWGSMADAKMQTFAYAYDATPSVYYHMRAHRNHDGVMAIIDNHISKRSDKESSITITYWLTDKSVNASQFGESLKNRTRRALNI